VLPEKWTKVCQNFRVCYTLHAEFDQCCDKTPNHAKFCGDRLKNAQDICNRKFVLPYKVGQSSPKIFRGCYPLRIPIMPNFIEIGQTSLEKSVTKIGPWTKKLYFITDGQKCDYLSRARSVQEARLKTMNAQL